MEVYRSDTMELHEGDRIRWTENDAGLGLVNSQTAEVAGVKNGMVTFRLEDGRALSLRDRDQQLHHLDRAWTSTVHAFQGRTVDAVIAAMEANNPHLPTQKTLYVEISRARHMTGSGAVNRMQCPRPARRPVRPAPSSRACRTGAEHSCRRKNRRRFPR